MKRSMFFLRVKSKSAKTVRVSRVVQPEHIVAPKPQPNKVVHPKNRVEVDPQEILTRFR